MHSRAFEVTGGYNGLAPTEQVMVNPDHIVSVRRNGTGTYLQLTFGYVYAEQSLEEVVERWDRAVGRE